MRICPFIEDVPSVTRADLTGDSRRDLKDRTIERAEPARIKADITVEDLAAKVGVGERFIYRIENEGKKPSYDILYKLIRELSILPDQIFFPEKQIEDSEMESLVRMLYSCDERSIQIIKATIKAALESQSKE